MIDTWTLLAGLGFLLALLLLVAAVVYRLIARGNGRPAAAPPPALASAVPASISRAMDDLKHFHADQIIGQQLGLAQAAHLGGTLGALAARPAAAASPTTAPPAAPAPAAGA